MCAKMCHKQRTWTHEHHFHWLQNLQSTHKNIQLLIRTFGISPCSSLAVCLPTGVQQCRDTTVQHQRTLLQKWSCVLCMFVCFTSEEGKKPEKHQSPHKHLPPTCCSVTMSEWSSSGSVRLVTWRLGCFDEKLEVDVLALTPRHQFLPLNFLVWKQRPCHPVTHDL